MKNPFPTLRRIAGRVKRRILRRPPPPPTTAETAAHFWDKQSTAETPMYWAEYAPVREYVNTCITGVHWVWPLVGFKAGWAYKPLGRGLSIGCGTGALERSAMYLNICEHIDAIDVSKASIDAAKREAKREKMRWKISYRVADCDRIELPDAKYDIVFFHGSLHHISDPDRLLDQVVRSLKPHGMLYIDDYVGPSRDEWGDEHLVHAREFFGKLDESLKMWPVNPPLDYSDPSEMIRSSRILPAIRERFDILHYKPYWGNFLFPMLSALRPSEMQKPERSPLLHELVAKEKDLVESGAITDPLFAVVIARRRP